jgi:hypothetical protein
MYLVCKRHWRVSRQRNGGASSRLFPCRRLGRCSESSPQQASATCQIGESATHRKTLNATRCCGAKGKLKDPLFRPLRQSELFPKGLNRCRQPSFGTLLLLYPFPSPVSRHPNPPPHVAFFQSPAAVPSQHGGQRELRIAHRRCQSRTPHTILRRQWSPVLGRQWLHHL